MASAPGDGPSPISAGPGAAFAHFGVGGGGVLGGPAAWRGKKT
jgi:translation initiation factor 4E